MPIESDEWLVTESRVIAVWLLNYHKYKDPSEGLKQQYTYEIYRTLVDISERMEAKKC